MTAGFRIVDHTADKAIEVWAADLGQLIEQAARGLVALLVDTECLQASRQVQVAVEAEEAEVLLHDALAQVLHLVEDDGLVPVQVHLDTFSPETVRLDIEVVPVAQAREHLHGMIKAVTYHNLEIAVDQCGLLRTQIVLDT